MTLWPLENWGKENSRRDIPLGRYWNEIWWKVHTTIYFLSVLYSFGGSTKTPVVFDIRIWPEVYKQNFFSPCFQFCLYNILECWWRQYQSVCCVINVRSKGSLNSRKTHNTVVVKTTLHINIFMIIGNFENDWQRLYKWDYDVDIFIIVNIKDFNKFNLIFSGTINSSFF